MHDLPGDPPSLHGRGEVLGEGVQRPAELRQGEERLRPVLPARVPILSSTAAAGVPEPPAAAASIPGSSEEGDPGGAAQGDPEAGSGGGGEESDGGGWGLEAGRAVGIGGEAEVGGGGGGGSSRHWCDVGCWLTKRSPSGGLGIYMVLYFGDGDENGK